MSNELTEIEANEIVDRENLAVVYSVERLEPIPLKDRIELVHLKDCGYTTVCEKGHKIGDKVVFIKYDTVVPKNELFSFMESFKYRVKPKSFTERDEFDNIIKKFYSQGIVLPLDVVISYCADRDCGNSEFSRDVDVDFQTALWKEGDDLTAFLGVRKYIPPPISGGGTSFGKMVKKGDFPTHIVSKTDEMNVCSKMRALEEIRGKDVYITLKIEGSSLTTMWDESRDELMVCSRNNQIGFHDTNKFWSAVNKYNLADKMKEFDWLSIQAELAGVGVQKNKLGLTDVDMYVFNMIDKRDRHRLGFDEMDMMVKTLGLTPVPLCCIIKNFDWSFDQIQEYADIQKYDNGEIAEGIVIRPIEPFWSHVLKDVWSVKCISREYKL